MVKDSFLWGYASNTVGGTTGWVNAAIEANVDDSYDGFNVMYAGFSHDFAKFVSTVTFNRWRTYLAFYTSGWRLDGWPETAKLRIYVADSQAHITPVDSESIADDFNIVITTVSGVSNRERVFQSSGDDNNPLYGFGDRPTYQGAWGILPATVPHNNLSEVSSNYSYQYLTGLATGTKTFDSAGALYRFRNGWLEIPIPIDMINNTGESHFRLGALEEITGVIPTVGNGQQDHFGWLQIHSAENINPPELVITYVSTDYRVSELRNCDLTIQRHLQNTVNNNVIFSGLNVLDGYPSQEVAMKQGRTIGMEHNYSASRSIEIGSNKNLNFRRFTLDICCDQRGELDDLTSTIYKSLYNKNLEILDFSYGFINPKPIGSIYCEYMHIIQLPEIAIDLSRSKFRNIIFTDFSTLASGI